MDVVTNSPSKKTFDGLIQLHESMDDCMESSMAITTMVDLLASMIVLQMEEDQTLSKQ
jgi:hypothetical protein